MLDLSVPAGIHNFAVHILNDIPIHNVVIIPMLSTSSTQHPFACRPLCRFRRIRPILQSSFSRPWRVHPHTT